MQVVTRFLAIVLFMLLIPIAYAREIDEKFMQAVKDNDPDAIKRYLSIGANINSLENGTWGWPALLLASRDGKIEIVRILVEKGADANMKGAEQYTSLILAAGNGHADVARLLLSAGADVNACNDKGITALMLAAQNGRLPMVSLLVEHGANIDLKTGSGDTALMYACEAINANPLAEKPYDVLANNKIATAKYLIRKGADVKARNSFGYTALISSAEIEMEDVELVTLLLDRGADINASNNYSAPLISAARNNYNKIMKALCARNIDLTIHSQGSQALMICIDRGNIEMARFFLQNKTIDVNYYHQAYSGTRLIQSSKKGLLNIVSLLIERGADVNKKNEAGDTALIAAVESGNSDIVRLLFKNGADIKIKNNNGESALLKTRLLNQTSFPEVVKVLLDNGADINEIDMNGNTILINACEKKQSNDFIRYLISKGARINDKYENGDIKLLYRALINNDLSLMKLLVSEKADINHKNKSGSTILHSAIQQFGKDKPQVKEEIAALLINSGIELNSEDNYGNIPLFLAARNGSMNLVRLLVEKGANVHAKNRSGENVLHHVSYTDTDIVKYLVDHNVSIEASAHGISPIFLATHAGNPATIQLLVDKGARVDTLNPSATMDFEETPLMNACRYCTTDAVRIILSRYPDVNHKDTNGWTALHIAAMIDRPGMVKLLLVNGAILDPRTITGETPLIIACINGQTANAAVLIEKGADVNSSDAMGITPLIAACVKGDMETIKLLIARGANINMKSKNDQSPLTIAMLYQHDDIIDFLKKAGAR